MARINYDFDRESLKTKDKFWLVINGKKTRFVAKESHKNKLIKWYPFRYFQDYKKPEPKYSKIKFIGTNYGKIPKTGFSENAYRGFGFTKPQGVEYFFRYLEEKIEAPLQGVMFTEDETVLKDGVFYISQKDFANLRKKTKSLVESSRREQGYLHQSILNQLFPKISKPPTKYVYTEGSLERFMDKFADEYVKLSSEDVESIINKLDVEKQAIVSTKKVVDRVYIEEVLAEFQELNQQRTHTSNLEEKWHKFFKRHTWIFSNLFSFPAILLRDKFSVSGHNLGGSTDKIVDFLVKNKLTQNIAFIEIKTHKTKLMQNTPYRKPDIYPVSKDVSGAIVQVIDQKMNFLKKHDDLTKGSSAQSLNSKCVILAGTIGDIKDKNIKNSFELFRLSNKEVEIVTYDELEEKMKTMLEIFTK